MGRLAEVRALRREAIDAQVAIFHSQAREVEAGIDHETDEHAELHRRFYEAWDRLPRWGRFQVWDAAQWRYERELEGSH